MKNDNSGFTLIEVMIAVVMLSVGVVALAGSAGLVTRMIGRGKMETRAAQAASRRIEALRLVAYSTTPRCTAGGFASGGPVTADNVTETWVVAVAGSLATAQVTVTHATAQGTHTDVLSTRIEC